MQNSNINIVKPNSDDSVNKLKQNNVIDGSSIIETVRGVNETVNTLNENGEAVESGSFSEKSKSIGEHGGSIGATGTTSGSQVTILPEVDVMIKETTFAIETLLKKKEIQLKGLSIKSKPFEYNNAVREIRFLNDLLGQLKNAAKLAKDFLINLWRQYVSKVI